MPITSAYRKQLRAIGHNLHAIVTIADKGLSANIKVEIDRALNDHELIKIKLNIPDRAKKKALSLELCEAHNAELIQSIGNIILVFRKADKPKPKLSNVIRPV